MKKKDIRRSIGPIVIVIALYLLVRGFLGMQLAPVSSDKTTQNFVIAKGESVNQTAADLKKDNLIRSEFFFKLYLKQSSLGDKLQAGSFQLSPSMTSEEIAQTLSATPTDVRVTLLEGWREEEMAAKLNSQLGIDSAEFIKKSKEGYMFPDTYLFPKDASVSYIVSTMEDNFDKKYTDNLKAQVKSKGLTESQGVILASIVEREARSDEARKMVASILLKRLKIGMALNADAAIQYALGFQKGENSWWKRSLGKDDLKINSPYNTYTNPGLPPGPICNPSLSSLEAVASADSFTPYLYYYHDLKGNSHYAKTLEEHNQNVADYP